eukprot:jgi/Hompol1/1734/HPOL_005703-RA
MIRNNEFQEDDVQEDDEECDPVYIHWVRKGDTVAKIAKMYQTGCWQIDKANELSGDQDQRPIEDRRYLVIPSASTFQDPVWDVDQERHELCRNFLILIREDDFMLAHNYLGKSNYNLPQAIENYYFDLC